MQYYRDDDKKNVIGNKQLCEKHIVNIEVENRLPEQETQFYHIQQLNLYHPNMLRRLN